MMRAVNARRGYCVFESVLCGLLLFSGTEPVVGQQATNPGESNVQKLLHLLQHGDEKLRRQSRHVLLRQIGPSDSADVPLIMDAFESRDIITRQSLQDALTRIGAASVPYLVKTVEQSDNANVRAGAAEALGNIHMAPESSIPVLKRSLFDDDWNVRRAAAHALSRFGESAEPALLAMTEVALVDSNPQVRAAAAVSLGQLHMRPNLSLPCLVQSLNDHHPRVRSASARAIARFGSHAASATVALTEALDDPDVGVQQAVLKSLASLGPSAASAVPALLVRLRSADVRASRQSVGVLQKIGPTGENDESALLEATKDNMTHVRRHAISAFGTADRLSPKATARLAELLRDDDDSVVHATLRVLGQLGAAATELTEPVAALLASNRRTVRARAEVALRRIAPDRASELLGEPFDAVQAGVADIATFAVGEYDWPQLHGSRFRNNAPAGNNIPTTWDPGKFDRPTGQWDSSHAVNIKWVAELGSQTWGSPVVANGRIFVGTNNGAGYLKRYPREIDLGCLLCFRESDGKFLWQHSSEKLITGRVHDWPLQGICSSPVVQGDRLWFVTNRGEVVCLDTNGFHDDEDDGPVTGVTIPVFDATANLGTIDELASTKSANSATMIQTIARLVRIAGLDAPRYLRLVRDQPPGTFTVVTYSNRPPICRIRYVDDKLRILSVADGSTLLEVNTDLLDGVDQGRVSPALQAQFADCGHDTSDARIEIVTPGEHWEITVGEEDQTRRLRLINEDQRLYCTEMLTPAAKNEADVVWTFDMMNQLGVSQHNMATCSPTIWNDTLFVCTSNGLDESHINLPAPEAPSFLAMDKNTGEVLWTDNSPGRNILHGQWSCPVVGVFDGVPQVIFPGGDGWLYSFRADRWENNKPELLWKFDANPKKSKWVLGGEGDRNNLIAVPVVYDELVYVAVGQDPEHGEGDGHLWCIDPTRRGDVSGELVVDADGDVMPHRRIRAIVEEPIETIFRLNLKDQQELCVENLSRGIVPDVIAMAFSQAGYRLTESTAIRPESGSVWQLEATIDGKQHLFRLNLGRSPMTAHRDTNVERVIENPNSAVVWHYDKFDQDGDGEIDFHEEFHRAVSSPVIKNDILVIADFSGLMHCLNARTGIPYWTSDLLAQCWSTPLVVENNVYVGDEDGDIAVFGLSPDPSGFTKTEFDSDPDIWKEPLHEINMGSSIYTTPIVANDVLLISTKSHLFAIEKKP